MTLILFVNGLAQYTVDFGVDDNKLLGLATDLMDGLVKTLRDVDEIFEVEEKMETKDDIN